MKFQLTKHKQMWEWLADNLSGEDGSLKPEDYLSKYKQQWFSQHNEKSIYNNCYACDYALVQDAENPCQRCPLWYDCKTGIYKDLLEAIQVNDCDKIYELCMLYASSPIHRNVEVV